jgi:PRTRC genetic system ThiF family protein
MTPIHYTANYLLNPTNPVSVVLIGAGGTGSQVLTTLARMSHALIQLGHPGFHVSVWDDDEVSRANLGRQLFAESELGFNKAVVLINRINRFFGTNWKAFPKRFDAKTGAKHSANLFITCVDTVAARVEVAASIRKMRKAKQNDRDMPYYWLDFGNSRYTGQVMLATVDAIKQPESKQYNPVAQLPFITDEFADVLQQSEADDNTPSCSLAEALTRQDLFINSTLATMGSALLWSLFRNGMTENRGFFLNLQDFRSQPVRV